MRRLAVQTRDDKYASNRDYQLLQTAVSLRLTVRTVGPIVFAVQDDPDGNRWFGFGGYVHAPRALTLQIIVRLGTTQFVSSHSIARGWNRVGVLYETHPVKDAEVAIIWDKSRYIDIWGISAGRLILPAAVQKARPTVETLAQSHIVPETFYFPHETPLALDINEEASVGFNLGEGATLNLKKCSYCGRLLPIDPEKLGALAFHGHRAKRTKHQNECRSCKKWRINDDFNPLRTTDQLHESSVITRERKMFLREPVILQEIKDRSGAGLKSQIWEKFGRECFVCHRKLALDQVQLDHTRPLAYLWPIDLHATCLCAEDNNHKKDKFPVDFYSDDELRRLSEVCGLPYSILRKRELNPEQLKRIVSDIVTFAQEWDPRHFAATASRIGQLQPEIDLFKILAERDPLVHQELLRRLRDRPAPVDSDFAE